MADIIQKIKDRELSQWHLLIASFMGSLASQKGVFNQAFLNRLLKRSMTEYIIPFISSLPGMEETRQVIAKASEPSEMVQAVVDLMDSVFSLTSAYGVDKGEDKVVVWIDSPTCRFCPIGVGDADLEPGDTFCPFPTMFEEFAKYLIGSDKIELNKIRLGAKTNVLTKRDGKCYIEYLVSF